MATSLDNQRLGAVFQSRPDILNGIKKAADTPARVTLFNDIATFVFEQINGPEPAAKRRRIDDGSANGNGVAAPGTNGASATSSSASEETVQLEIKEISVSVPQRKKFDLCFTNNHFYARAPGTTGPVQGIAYAWKDIEHAFYLPIPEKTQVQHNYILFPRGAALASIQPKSDDTPTPPEPLVFTVPSTPPKQGTIAGPQSGPASSVSDNYRSLFDWALSAHLRAADPSSPTPIVAADPAKFHSVVKQPQRPSEKAVHVKAFRGSKDGYLFFLPTGILWGFKKPLLFMPLERIAAVSYTSVLQRTFNMVVEVFAGDGSDPDNTEEIEFAMLDQEDYQGIDESYVRRHRLQDRSMAETRRAKLELAENLKAQKAGEGDGGSGAAVAGAAAGGAAVGANGGLVGTDGMTELQRAHAELEQTLQDEDEDEDEEDYDPGSEGESEGSGESSDEEDGDGDGDQEMEDGDDDEDEDDE